MGDGTGVVFFLVLVRVRLVRVRGSHEGNLMRKPSKERTEVLYSCVCRSEF